ncbi:GFA family protein [Arhodomonas aquaeolei]|uniref:GFA family protein n=1 Tax=Arhodomonas aquaeolei TaxID=2369 RepID=UPI0040413DFA
MEISSPHKGGCMCGAIRYEAKGEPRIVVNCHCSSCRRHTGAPVVTLVIFVEEQIKFTKGERKLYESSPGVRRAFCGDCGTSLTWEARSKRFPDTNIIDLHISTFDRPEAFNPTQHDFYEERIPWFDVVDTLPRFVGDRELPLCHGPEA